MFNYKKTILILMSSVSWLLSACSLSESEGITSELITDEIINTTDETQEYTSVVESANEKVMETIGYSSTENEGSLSEGAFVEETAIIDTVSQTLEEKESVTETAYEILKEETTATGTVCENHNEETTTVVTNTEITAEEISEFVTAELDEGPIEKIETTKSTEIIEITEITETEQTTTIADVVERPAEGIFIFEADIGACHRELAMQAYKEQNQIRSEYGLSPLSWSEEMYDYAISAASALGHYAEQYGYSAAKKISHDLTAKLLEKEITGSTGTYMVTIGENLQWGGCALSQDNVVYRNENISPRTFLDTAGHRGKLLDEDATHGAVAVYFVDIKEDGYQGDYIASFVYWNENIADYY